MTRTIRSAGTAPGSSSTSSLQSPSTQPRRHAVDVSAPYGNDRRSGAYRVSGLPDRAQVAWTAQTGSPVVAAPAYAGDTLIVATAGNLDADGAVHAFDARTGAERWRHTYHDLFDDGLEIHDDWLVDVDDDVPGVISTPAVWGTWVFVEEWRTSRWIYVHDLRSGEVVHTIERGGTPTVVGDLLLIHEVEAGARALRLPDLTEVWRGARSEIGVESDGWLRACPTFGPDGTAYAALGMGNGSEQSGIVAFDPSTGEVLFECGGWEEHAGFAHAHPVIAEDLVWTQVGNAIVGMDPRTGEQRHSHRPTARMNGDRGLAVTDGKVFVLDRPTPGPFGDDSHLQAIDSVSGDLQWSAPLTPTRPLEPVQVVGSPVVAGGTVYVADKSGVVRAFSTESGEARWTIETGHGVGNVHDDVLLSQVGESYFDEDAQAVLPGDGIVYIRTETGVVALQ
ncbi:outer membrane protein assembly factor BamB family protein [Streptomyces sp. 8N114]|uniref:outer membrane protein assembly factor BamB family protein n=1 Tax=Streptomyces sp. 8N114 TaxID=3457419 RepID=UPI003FD1B30A